MPLSIEEEKKSTRKVTILSIFLVVSVFLLKFIFSFFTNSLSFYAELTDSITDFLIVAITYISLRLSQKPSDLDHMFGHYKLNSFASLLQSLLTISVYIGVLYFSISALFSITEYSIENAGIITIPLVVILLMNFIVARYVIKIGKQTNSATIKAQGENFKGDFFRNIAIIIGLLFAFFNPMLAILDPLFASIFSIIAIIENLKVFKLGFNELMDYNTIDPERISKLERSMKDIEGVYDFRILAIRTAGNTIEANASVSLNDKQSLYGISEMSQLIKNKIASFFPSYRSNSIIQVNPYSTHIHEPYHDIIEKVLSVGKNFQDVQNIKSIHNVTLDVMLDEIVIQFHISVDQDLHLLNAHSIASELEEKIKQEIQNLVKKAFKSSRIQIRVDSHIEPGFKAHRTHDHGNKGNLNDFYEEIIKNQIKTLPEIKGYHNISIMNEIDGIYISLHIYLGGDLTVKEAHWISEKLEFYLKRKIPNLKRCVIHTEPAE